MVPGPISAIPKGAKIRSCSHSRYLSCTVNSLFELFYMALPFQGYFETLLIRFDVQ